MPLTAFGEFYQTGTVALTAGSKHVVLTAGLWVDIVQGDILEAQGRQQKIDTIAGDFLSAELMLPWSGTTASTVSYVISKDSKARFDPALTQAKTREFIALLDDASVFYHVEGAEPDDGIGENGDFALKTNTGQWQQWEKIADVWVLQGTPVGILNRGVWSAVTAYAVNDVVTRLGAAYISGTSNTNKPPESNPSDWTQIAFQGDAGPAGPTGPNGGQGSAGATGPAGASGKTIHNGIGAPSNLLGADGDFYIADDTKTLYGPKTTGTWLPGVSIIGPPGLEGDQGQGIEPDASGTLAQRVAYDNQPQGFVFLQTDTSPFRLWIKASNTTADWAGPTYIGGVVAVGDWGSFADSPTEFFDYGSF